MKTYAPDGTQAMSRILALTMIVDGHIRPSELRAMHASPFLDQVGADPDTFDRTLQELCEDLLESATNRDMGVVDIDAAMLDAVLAEIRDPLLQICMFKTMLDIVHADALLDARETLLVRRAARYWFVQGHGAIAATMAAGLSAR